MVGMPKKLKMFKNQNYSDLKKKHQDLGTLFVDATFPAIDAVIGTSRIPSNIEWKRPSVSFNLKCLVLVIFITLIIEIC